MYYLYLSYVGNYICLKIQTATEVITIVAPVNEILSYVKTLFTRTEYKLEDLEEIWKLMEENADLWKRLEKVEADSELMKKHIEDIETKHANALQHIEDIETKHAKAKKHIKDIEADKTRVQEINLRIINDMRMMREKMRKLERSDANLKESMTILRQDHDTLRQNNDRLTNDFNELARDYNGLKQKVIETFTFRNVVTVSESFELWEVKALTARYRETNIANANQIVIDIAYGNPGNIDRHPYFNRETDRLIDSFEVANGRTMLKKLFKDLKDSMHVKVIHPDKKLVVDVGYEYEVLDAIDDIKRDADSTASELTE